MEERQKEESSEVKLIMFLFSLFSSVFCELNFVEILSFNTAINLHSELYLWGKF